MDVSPQATTLTPVREATPAPSARSSGGADPLIWAALLIWLSIEGIGEGLQALGTLLGNRSVTALRQRTPDVTPS